MSEQEGERIVREKMSRPHIEGTRIDVLTIYEYVEGQGLDPTSVADQLNVNVADVHRALAYYYEHPDEMRTVRERWAAAHEEFAEMVEQHRPPGRRTPPSGGSPAGCWRRTGPSTAGSLTRVVTPGWPTIYLSIVNL